MKLLTIIKKEILDQFRDKRTIIAALLMPAVIVPMLLYFASGNTAKEINSTPIKIIILSDDDIIKKRILESYGNTIFIQSDSPQEAIVKGKADLLIDASKSGQVYSTITIYYDSSRSTSMLAYMTIYDLLEVHFKKPENSVLPLTITAYTIRSEKESKTLLTLSLLLPVLLMVFAASSTMSASVDMSSGEKERSTLEILLSCNISHSLIIGGKVLSASIIGFASTTSLLAGLAVCSHFYPEITGGISLYGYCGLKNLFIILSMTAISIILFSSIGMVIGVYAKSVKEGTILTLPVIILSSALSSGLAAGDPFSFNKYYSMIPILNISHVIRSVIYNNYDYLMFISSILSNIICAVFLILLSTLLLKNESVIFRS